MPALHTLEKWIALVVMGLSLFLLGKMAMTMASSSLGTDEFGTVGSFSSKGPARVMTDYRAPKNHVFFNLLNSVLPGRESLAPARVRALSILATVLTALALIAYASLRDRWMEAALLLALWSSAPQMLPLSMEARGYGFLGLFAVTATLAVLEYLPARNPRWLWVLGASVALGTYTVPGFLFFGASLMLLLWVVERSRLTLVAGAITFAAILALYAPLLTQVFAAFTGFHQDKAEADFISVHALVRSLKLYLYPCDDWEAWAVLFLLAFAPFAAPSTDRGENTAQRIVIGACLAYFAILLVLRTPPIRIAAFALLPLGIAGLWAIGGWFRKPALLRALVCGLIGVFLVFHLAIAIATFEFTPPENWSLAGRAIDTAFPKSTRVEFKRYAKYLQHTLPGAAERSADFDEAAFASGKLVVADAANKWAENDRFTPPAGLDRVVQWVIPGTIRDIDLTLRVPPGPGIAGAPSTLVDGDAKTGADPAKELAIHCEPPDNSKAIIVLFNRAIAPGELLVTAPDAAPLIAGNAVTVPLRTSAQIDIRLQTAPGSNLRAVEAWITQ